MSARGLFERLRKEQPRSSLFEYIELAEAVLERKLTPEELREVTRAHIEEDVVCL